MCQYYMLTLRHFSKRSSWKNVRVFCVPLRTGQQSGTLRGLKKLHARFQQKGPLKINDRVVVKAAQVPWPLSCIHSSETRYLPHALQSWCATKPSPVGQSEWKERFSTFEGLHCREVRFPIVVECQMYQHYMLTLRHFTKRSSWKNVLLWDNRVP